MKNVFTRLFHVLKNSNGNPYEDFLTELFAEHLSEDTCIVEFFTQLLDEPVKELNHLSVDTQVTYPALMHHQTDSRPDIVIQFYDGQQHHIVFIECKLASSEGVEQLSRYADHLNVFSAKGSRCYLIYLTQYFEEKDGTSLSSKSPNLKFMQLRWYQIYKWIKQSAIQSDYASKLLDYMEEIGLEDNRKFSPIDVYGIQHMNRLQRMMDECMDDAVDGLMTELFGKALQQYNRYNQLKYMERYVKASEQEGRATEVAVGFYISDDDYPIISVVYEFNPRRCPDSSKVIAAMHDFIATHPEWETFDLNSNAEWQGISCDRSLVKFLHHEDHILEIQKFYLEKLKELHAIKVKHPDLYWK